MRANEFLDEVNIDNDRGWGQTPKGTDVDYFGMRVQMRPSTFLKLAIPLTGGNPDIEKHISQGGAVASPFLDIQIPHDWLDGKFEEAADVKGHEGRNRMKAILKLEGDAPIEVHLFLLGGIRARDINQNIILALSQGMYSERTKNFINGPLFK